MSGLVFHNIAEGIMAQSLKLDVKDARDSLSVCVPDVKRGNVLAADYVLRHLGITTDTPWSGSYTKGGPVWGVAHKEHNRVKLSSQKLPALAKVPDVKGMGARDAVYLLESRGIKVRIQGRGKVVEQSLAPGSSCRKNAICEIRLR